MKISNFIRIPSLCTLASCFLVTAAYEIECIYPTQWTDNLFSALQFGGFFKVFMRDNKVETPVVIRSSHHSTMCRGMCLSLHDPNVLDPFEERPTWTVPEFGQNGHSMAMCIGQCILYVFEDFYDFVPLAIETFRNEFGLDYSEPSARQDIHDAWREYAASGLRNDGMMRGIMTSDDYHPYTMGHIAGYYVQQQANNDGWNEMGSLTYDRESGMETPCTGSCRKFQDTVGYEPVVDPRIHSPMMDKYNYTGDYRKWQPLQEGNDGGSLKEQQFVTPHLGQKAKTYLRPSTLTLVDPEYDLHAESMTVIDRLRDTTTSPYMRDSVRFFDDKLRVRGAITNNLRKEFSQLRGVHSFEDEILSLVGISAGEYDGVVQSWHEKLEHDLVRPTTVIKHWGSDMLNTYGGDDMHIGPEDIAARDFEAFIRVMPHPEFPSGSSCLCTTYYEFTDIYLHNKYNDTLKNITWSEDGRGYVLQDMEELRNVCGESRLWGGMHYTAAIEAGEQICEGLGQLAYDYVERLRNEATFPNAHYYGDQLGTCSQP